MEKKTIGLIASRLESTRLPRKALAEIGGKSMTGLLVERLRGHARMLSGLCLCTTRSAANQTLVDMAGAWGIDAHRGEEKDLLGNFIGAGRKLGAAHFVRITGDNPFTDPAYIDRLVAAHIEHGAEYSRVEGLPVGVTAEVVSLEAAVRLHASVSDPEPLEALTLHLFRPGQFRCLVMEALPQHTRPHYRLTVDTPEDLAFARRLMAAFPDSPNGPSLESIIGWMDAHPHERLEMKADTPVKLPGDEVVTYTAYAALLAERSLQAEIRLRAA